MAYLNYLYFLIIVYLYFKYIFGEGIVVKNPLREGNLVRMNGPETFWCLVFATSVLSISAEFGIDLAGIRMLIIEFLCIVGIWYSGSNHRIVWSIPFKLYMAYLVWMVIGCFYSPGPFYGIRTILKYIYPVLIGIFASSVVSDKLVFMKSALLSRAVAFVSAILVVSTIANYLLPGTIWYATALTINYIAMTVFSLALFFHTKQKTKNLILAVLFTLPCIIWVFRTSLVGTALALMIFFIFKYTWKAAPIVAGVIVLFILSVFYIPEVRNKMFFNGEDVTYEDFKEGHLSMDDVNSNSRFEMWDYCMDHYYDGHELTGSGTGAIQNMFYSGDMPLNKLLLSHNDYVQMICDNGIIGVVLFGLSFLGIIVHCFIVYNNKSRYPTSIRIAAITAGPSLGAMMLAMYTDNVLSYSLATLSVPLGFYGMMLGMISAYNKNPQTANV